MSGYPVRPIATLKALVQQVTNGTIELKDGPSMAGTPCYTLIMTPKHPLWMEGTREIDHFSYLDVQHGVHTFIQGVAAGVSTVCHHPIDPT